LTREEERLEAARTGTEAWRRWGPYLSERQWGTVREDYSADGTAWEYISHDNARSHAYRWGEDGIAGISDDRQQLCFALALWNGVDPILKERLFGLTGNEGNHGEDVKECYFYLDNVPSHAYMKYLYKYPQRAFPYTELVQENRRRSRDDAEYELLDTGAFDDNRYFDVFIEYAKEGPLDLLIRISAINRGAQAATLHVVPTLWFKDDWTWFPSNAKPGIEIDADDDNRLVLRTSHRKLEPYWLYCEPGGQALFTDNESNKERLYGVPNSTAFVKDGIHEFIVHGKTGAVNPDRIGSKAAIHYVRTIGVGETAVIRMRLSSAGALRLPPETDFEATFSRRRQEADAFYHRVTPFAIPDDMRNVQRQAFAGMLWTKQYYRYLVSRWLEGDPAGPSPPEQRKHGRNHDWWHLSGADVLSMPDKWEYPWFAAWDMAFHVIALAMIDPEFAKQQLLLLTREWYMHPNGQIPAYEWAFGDVNPPVQAWAAIRIYQIEHKIYGRQDRAFLERIFQKLLINFTWWVNRKDTQGNNLFEGGFLGLDNIGAFDRTSGLPSGGILEQADGTSWMAMYCLNMLMISIELGQDNPAYQDLATKFFEHFVYIGAAVNRDAEREGGLWHEEAGFYFDSLKLPDGQRIPIAAHTIAGLIPIFAITIVDRDSMRAFPGFDDRYGWFAKYRPQLLQGLADLTQHGVEERVRFALVDSRKLRRLLEHMLSDEGLLSRFGIRSVSKQHAASPFVLDIGGQRFVLDYQPGESTSGMFGGNSNWRGPVWFPLNFLIIESLQKHHYYLGDEFTVAMPSETATTLTLWDITTQLSYRLISIFLKDASGRRPVNGTRDILNRDPHWQDLILFHEYFHGDSGAGLGASHQTGWAGIVAKLIRQYGEYAPRNGDVHRSAFDSNGSDPKRIYL
jgi:hypothetical protein